MDVVTMPGAIISPGLRFLGHGHSAEPAGLGVEFILSIDRQIE
jgi:hypothetical protein